MKVEIREWKIKDDALWDGLKGYVTNTSLTAQEVCQQYNSLWVIERALRVTKGILELRPMFHLTEKRIEAHVSICFAAYKVYKKLERILSIIGIVYYKNVITVKLKLSQSG